MQNSRRREDVETFDTCHGSSCRTRAHCGGLWRTDPRSATDDGSGTADYGTRTTYHSPANDRRDHRRNCCRYYRRDGSRNHRCHYCCHYCGNPSRDQRRHHSGNSRRDQRS